MRQTSNYTPNKCAVCGVAVFPHWKYCQEHTKGNILLDMDMIPKKKEVPVIRSIHDFGDGKCMMCGMELLPEYREYHNAYTRGTSKHTIRNKKFCDKMCQAYFEKRLYADEHGIKLEE